MQDLFRLLMEYNIEFCEIYILTFLTKFVHIISSSCDIDRRAWRGTEGLCSCLPVCRCHRRLHRDDDAPASSCCLPVPASSSLYGWRCAGVVIINPGHVGTRRLHGRCPPSPLGQGDGLGMQERHRCVVQLPPVSALSSASSNCGC